MKNTALLTGPYDWDPALVPLAEFETRIAVVRRAMAGRGASSLLVHGHSMEHGALAYLTGFTPKLGPAFALVPREGSLRILASGGAGMIGSAKLLTWVDDVRPLNDLQSSLGEWLSQTNREGRQVLGLWGGIAMSQRPYVAVAAAMEPLGEMIVMDEQLDALRRRKSTYELQLLREACRILTDASEAFERSASAGSGARSAALAAERAAFAGGAQDVRILASARNGGPPLPFDGADDVRVAPLLACLAVRFSGYWAEGLLTVTSPQGGALARAEAALAAMFRESRPGATSSDLLRVAQPHLSPYQFHPSLHFEIANGIGLSFEEQPKLGGDPQAKFETGGVYVLRAGALGEGSDNAVVSAMIAVNATGIDVLWPAANSSVDPEDAKGSR